MGFSLRAPAGRHDQGPLSHTTEYRYDADGNIVSQTGGNGNTTGLSFDATGELTTTLWHSTTEVTQYTRRGG
jgi:YD repeat-containing protein